MQRPRPAAPRSARRQDRGAVIPLVAIALTTLMLGAAFSVDLGRMRTTRRDLQADADFLALDAASVLDGMTADEALPYVLDEAQDSADRNQYQFEAIQPEHIELGIWEMNTFTPVAGSGVPNAVRITLTDSVEMLFDFSTDRRQVTRSAIGVDDFLPDDCLPLPCDDTPPPPDPPPPLRAPASRAEVGSVLARLDTYQQPTVDAAFNAAVEAQATFMNHIYSEFLGVDVAGGVDFGAGETVDPDPVTGPATGLRLDAISYQGLAAAQVSIDQIAGELGARGVLAVGTVDELLSSTITVADFLDAAADVLDPSATSVDAQSIVGDIAAAMDQTLTMELGDHIRAYTGRGAALETFVNVDDLLLGTVSIINNRHFVDAEIPLNFPDDLDVAPVTLARVTVVEPPQIHTGYHPAGTAGPSTSQIRVEVNLPISALDLELDVLGLDVFTTTGNIPLVLEVAKAESFYEDMACRTASATSWTDLLVENGGVAIGFDSTASGILEVAGGNPTAMVHGSVLGIDLTASTSMTLHRTWSSGAKYAGELSSNAAILNNAEVKRHVPPYETEWLQYPTIMPEQAGSVDGTYADLTFTSPNLSGTLRSALKDALAPVIAQVDTVLADPLLQSMGVTLAGADARIHKLRCRGVHVV